MCLKNYLPSTGLYHWDKINMGKQKYGDEKQEIYLEKKHLKENESDRG